MRINRMAERIISIYEDIEDDNPDISTERLLQMTADRFNDEYLSGYIDVSDVVDILAEYS